MPRRLSPLLLIVALGGVTGALGAEPEVGYHANGRIQWESLSQQGVVRETKWYDEDGRLSARAIFSDGRQTLSEGYHDDGSIAWQLRELGNDRQEMTRFNPGHRLAIRYQLSAGQVEGTTVLYSAEGLPRQSITFRNGTLHGPARTFHANGQLESDYAYQDGQLTGGCRFFSPSGALLAERPCDQLALP